MNKKYELTDKTIKWYGRTLHRIRALKDLGEVKKGELGGYVQGEHNLSHEGNCWIYANAKVYDDARVRNDAIVWGYAIVRNNAIVIGNAEVRNNAIVSGYAYIKENAYITSSDDFLCIGQIGSRNDYTTFYLDKDKNIWVSCGCFNGTIEEFKEAVEKTHGDNKYGKQYSVIIKVIKGLFGTNPSSLYEYESRIKSAVKNLNNIDFNKEWDMFEHLKECIVKLKVINEDKEYLCSQIIAMEERLNEYINYKKRAIFDLEG